MASMKMAINNNTTKPDSKSNNQQSANINVSSSSNNNIIGHYELKKTLGKGNFSTVKLAQHRITQHEVAIKVVKTSVLSDDNLMKINREIDILKKLGKHTHIVKLYQVIKTKRYFMLVTEYCADGELYDYLVDKGKLTESQSCDYFLQVLSAVEYLHEHNIVHRDLKAENLLLTDQFKTIKIADFGFANYYKRDNLLSTWCGSPPYAAPELFKGLKYVGPPVDIWSMGVILYVLVCGSLPFDGHNLVYLKSRVLSGKFRIPFFMSTECEGLIKGMLRLDPERRFNIRQIRAHNWVNKYKVPLLKQKEPDIPKVHLDTTNSCSNSNHMIVDSNAGSFMSLDKTGKSRGQSLDLEDDKKIMPVIANEDSSMLCLSNAHDEKQLLKNISQKELTKTTLQRFVDDEIANAVSNMSLDSNNSSMSVSQCTESGPNLGSSSTQMSGQKVEAKVISARSFSKESSFDDQIIDYMVDELKVVGTRSPIRHSVVNSKYDDLHAIYRLLKDQPEKVYESLARKAKFKIPSLPLLNKEKSIKKPSITSGFFNEPTSMNNMVGCTIDFNNVNTYDKKKEVCPISQYHSPETTPTDNFNSDQFKAINLSQVVNEEEILHCQTKTVKVEETQPIWNVPPQLFLTPPSENRALDTSSNKDSKSSIEEVNIPNNSVQSIDEGTPSGRRSFDSTFSPINISNIQDLHRADRLSLMSGGARPGLWDSSILDTLATSTPPLNTTPNHGSIMCKSSVSQENQRDQTGGLVQNMRTTDFQQYTIQFNDSNTPDTSRLMTQLNSLVSSATSTQSSMLVDRMSDINRNQVATQVKFTPNNLINQNFNPCVAQDILNTNRPDPSLLDPNGLVSGLERRASDGQASYNSLTNPDCSRKLQTTTEIDSSVSRASTFLSSSSNQISTNTTTYQQSSISTDMNNNTIQSLCRNQESISSNSMVNPTNEYTSSSDFYRKNDQSSTQCNPLDLRKGSRDSGLTSTDVGLSDFSPRFDNLWIKSSSLRSHSTTSESVVFHQFPLSATTSPKNSLLTQTAKRNMLTSIGRTCPSSVSLTGGGLGHLLHRRKRHSLENESHNNRGVSHPHGQHANCYPSTSNDSNRLMRNSNTQYLPYPLSSHIGQLRNFAQTFSHKKSKRQQSTPFNWNQSYDSQIPASELTQHNINSGLTPEESQEQKQEQ